MKPARVAVAAAAVFFLPSLVHAHSPIEGIGRFYGGMLHPLLVPSHLLLLIGLGLWIGQQGLRHIEVGLLAFAAGLLPGLACAGLGYASPLPVPLLLAPAAMMGLWVAAGWKLPREVIGVVALAAGLLIGLDSLPDAGSPRELALTLLGTGLGAGFLLVHEVALTEFLQRPWQRIGVRILGSWVGAISIMVLALAVAPGAGDRLP